MQFVWQNEALEIKTSLFDVYLQRIQQLSNNLYSNADVYKQIQIEEPGFYQQLPDFSFSEITAFHVARHRSLSDLSG